MGRGLFKAKNKLKMQNLRYCWAEIERLAAENKALKEDPTSIVGKFLNEFNEVIGQNQRLSALSCAMITKFGGEPQAVSITRDEIEVFRGKRLQVKIATPEGVEKFEDSPEYIFTFVAIDKDAPNAPEAHDPMVECTDPACTLPKDFKHTHDAPVEAPPPAEAPVDQAENVVSQAENSPTSEVAEAS